MDRELKNYHVLTTEQLKEVVQETVQETLKTIGINTEDPYRMQGNFLFLDRLRGRFDEISRFIGNAIMYGLGTAVLALLIWGLDSWKNN